MCDLNMNIFTITIPLSWAIYDTTVSLYHMGNEEISVIKQIKTDLCSKILEEQIEQRNIRKNNNNNKMRNKQINK